MNELQNEMKAYYSKKNDQDWNNFKESKQIHDMMDQYIQEHPDKVTYLLNLYLISRHLERLADHATNIAEEVVYLIEGEIVRHEEF